MRAGSKIREIARREEVNPLALSRPRDSCLLKGERSFHFLPDFLIPF